MLPAMAATTRQLREDPSLRWEKPSNPKSTPYTGTLQRFHRRKQEHHVWTRERCCDRADGANFFVLNPAAVLNCCIRCSRSGCWRSGSPLTQGPPAQKQRRTLAVKLRSLWGKKPHGDALTKHGSAPVRTFAGLGAVEGLEAGLAADQGSIRICAAKHFRLRCMTWQLLRLLSSRHAQELCWSTTGDATGEEASQVLAAGISRPEAVPGSRAGRHSFRASNCRLRGALRQARRRLRQHQQQTAVVPQPPVLNTAVPAGRSGCSSFRCHGRHTRPLEPPSATMQPCWCRFG